MYNPDQKIVPVYIENEMKNSYISYAMSVIIGRALPDVRDGLKPVHRRILYAMKDLGLENNKSYKKSARIVGECLGKYHPHGDTAVYDTMVRMVQDFSLRYPLVDGQGNFGSIDGDSPAAMRYTEARLSSISEEILKDLDKDTVDFVPNFDESLKEPTLLPAALPNLLINGSSGIAVGMATNIPPHNLTEVINGIVATIDNPDISIKELMKKIPAPDFPSGGIICGRSGIRDAYHTGRGILKIHAKAHIEKLKNSRQAIIITELPYQVNKANLIESIASLVQDKKIEGIADLRDESDREGMRIVVDLRRDIDPQVVLNLLFKHTQMKSTFGIIMLALVNRQPRVLNLRQVIDEYIKHRQIIVRRRTKYELDKAERRAHILEGLKTCLANLDDVINLIKKSKSVAIAKENLIKKLSLSAIQTQAILEMQLQRLTALEREKIEEEYLGLIKLIEKLKSILKSEAKILDIIKEELAELKKKYGDDRRTEIADEVMDLEVEDLIPDETVAITVSHNGYIKRQPLTSYRQQHRGGKGVTGGGIKEEDFAEHLFIASTHNYILLFTNQGKLYWLKVHAIPVGSRISKGRALINLLQLGQGEALSSIVPVKEFAEGRNLVMTTKNGRIKKTDLLAFSSPRKGGIIALKLDKDDELIAAGLTSGKDEIFLATRQGKAIRFKENQVRNMGRAAAGVKAITLAKGDRLIAMVVVNPESNILTVTENGFGKCTRASEYRLQSRGGKGIINIKTTEKNGLALTAKIVTDNDELMLITHSGMVVRCPVKDIRVAGRSTQGVRLIALKNKDKMASCAKLVKEQEAEPEAE